MKRKTSINRYTQSPDLKVSKNRGRIFPDYSIVIVMILLIQSVNIKAQEVWTINMCINYALENNIDLNIAYNNVDKQKVNLGESKVKLLPNLNMGSSVNVNFGRNIDGNTNNVTFNQTLSNNYWLSSSIDLFEGLMKYNSIIFNKYLLSASKEEVRYLKNQLIFNVLTFYYTVLYSIGLENVAKSQVALSEMQYRRMQKIVDVGRESPIIVQELESQWASDKLSLTHAENNLSKAVLDLKQLLRLDANQSFTVDTVLLHTGFKETMLAVDSLFDVAVSLMPEIKQQEYLYQATKKDLAVVRGGILPRIYLSAGFNTGYFNGDSLSYNTQMENNQNQMVNLGIVIPIFNHASTYSRIKRKQIAVKNQEFVLQKQQDILYTEIWNAVNDVQSSEKELQSAQELFEFSEVTLKNVTSKMEKGLAGTTDYEASKQRFVSAKASLLKARLIYIMRKQMLNFYQTGTWNHLM